MNGGEQIDFFERQIAATDEKSFIGKSFMNSFIVKPGLVHRSSLTEWEMATFKTFEEIKIVEGERT